MERFLIYGLALGLIAAPAAEFPATSAEPLRIGVSIYPLKDLVEQIAGREARVFFTIPANANPHAYEPTPSVVRRLRDVELFFCITPAFDGWVARFLSKSAQLVYLQESRSVTNPHIWLSPRRAVAMVGTIAEALSRLKPQSRGLFTENLNHYRDELRRLDEELVKQFAPLAGRKFFLWHPSWNYFAADYGLEVAGIIEESGHGDEPSVRDFQQMAARAKADNIRVVVLDLNIQSQAALALTREIGGTLLRLDALGDPRDPEKSGYIGLMRWNARRLAKALGVAPR